MTLRRVCVTPVLLVLAAVAIIVWSRRGDQSAAEAAVLSGSHLAAKAREHAWLSVVSTLLAVAVALPAGIAATRSSRQRLAGPAVLVANLGQTIPTVALLAIMFTITGLGFRTAVFALWAYSLLPVLRNTIVGLRGVDPAAVEAARGMGMSGVQVLVSVELPLAWPVIMAGIRTAAVVNVGTAALATFVGAGGLGEVINTGIQNQRDRILFAGASLTAVLALAADWLVATLAWLTTGRRTARQEAWRSMRARRASP